MIAMNDDDDNDVCTPIYTNEKSKFCVTILFRFLLFFVNVVLGLRLIELDQYSVPFSGRGRKGNERMYDEWSRNKKQIVSGYKFFSSFLKPSILDLIDLGRRIEECSLHVCSCSTSTVMTNVPLTYCTPTKNVDIKPERKTLIFCFQSKEIHGAKTI